LAGVVSSISSQSFQSYVQENILNVLTADETPAGFCIDASHHAAGYQKSYRR
jgi:hypothetical protein